MMLIKASKREQVITSVAATLRKRRIKPHFLILVCLLIFMSLIVVGLCLPRIFHYCAKNYANFGKLTEVLNLDERCTYYSSLSPYDFLNHTATRLGDKSHEITVLAPKSLWSRIKYSSGIGDPLPLINLNMDFESYKSLEEQRTRFIEMGYISNFPESEPTEVKAEIEHQGKKIPVKIKLKGLFLDHLLDPRKWSLRIKTTDGTSIFGMRRFSLQHPSTRSYQGERLFQDSAKASGLISPRYFFVDVKVNGEPIGLMALEEQASKELIEYSQNREGAIFRFSGDQHNTGMLEGTLMGHPLEEDNRYYCDDFRTADIQVYQAKKSKKNPTLNAQIQFGVAALNAVQQQILKPSEVFDVKSTAKYLSLAIAWRSQHALHWNNVKFYLNPITFKLHPIPYESNLPNVLEAKTAQYPDPGHWTLPMLLLGDDLILEETKRQLSDLHENSFNEKGVSNLRSRQTFLLDILRREFPILRETDLSPLENIDTSLSVLNDLTAISNGQPMHDNLEGKPWLPNLPQPVLARIVKGEATVQLDLINTLKLPVSLSNIAVTVNGTSVSNDKIFVSYLPETIEGNQNCDPSISKKYVLSGVRPTDEIKITGTVKVDAAEGVSSFTLTTKDFPAVLASHPLTATSTTTIRNVRHLTIDEKRKTISVKPGNWHQDEFIILPPDYRFIAKGNTTINFSENAGFLVHGPVEIAGNDNSNVIFRASNANTGWLGMAIMPASEKNNSVKISDASFVGMKSPQVGAWQLTGGLTIYKSVVSLNKLTISSSLGEDALNVVNSSIEATGLSFHSTKSDALDGDFITGHVRDSEFTDVGGDAFDVSGSHVTLIDSTFRNIHDKAVSAGERSTITAVRLNISESGTGIASKDSSMVDVYASELNDINYFGVMAYQKKSEYGSSELFSHETAINVPSGIVAVAQTGSLVVVNGIETQPQEVNVEKLYESVMKK